HAFEDLLLSHALAAEVVAEEHSAIGLDLQRRAVGAAALFPRRVEHLDLELSANLNQRSRDTTPPTIRGLVGLQPVDGRVENRHHLAAADIQSHRDDDRRSQQPWDPARERGLAVARRTVEEAR